MIITEDTASHRDTQRGSFAFYPVKWRAGWQVSPLRVSLRSLRDLCGKVFSGERIKIYNICFFAFLLFASFILTASAPERMVEVCDDFVAIYPQPTDSFPPVLIARRKQTFRVHFSQADDSGKIWFCLAINPSTNDTGWALAHQLRYIAVSIDSAFALSQKGALKRKDKKRRYAALRKHPEWPIRVRQAIRKGEIILYMTKDQLWASWGEPDRTAKAFMVGIGNYRVLFYRSNIGESSIGVTMEGNRVTGWTEE